MEKILIFKSQTTGAIYYWHWGTSNKVTVMKAGKGRGVGSIHLGIPQPILQNAYTCSDIQFKVGDAVYIILARI